MSTEIGSRTRPLQAVVASKAGLSLIRQPEDALLVFIFSLDLVATDTQHLQVARLVASAVPQRADMIHLRGLRWEGMPAATAACPACAVDRSAYCLPDAVTGGTAVPAPAAFAVGDTRDSHPGACHARTSQHEHPRGLRGLYLVQWRRGDMPPGKTRVLWCTPPPGVLKCRYEPCSRTFLGKEAYRRPRNDPISTLRHSGPALSSHLPRTAPRVPFPPLSGNDGNQGARRSPASASRGGDTWEPCSALKKSRSTAGCR
ncbi:hypothetical protein ATK36_3204 [Amycolatopsis sulphurea]|uniref:Uncharacterized protein n=1 Tax=Amycolatopsis sulphurea TaxID=76022 RepID=A0A2A9FCA5_9PSEU|nr:hypothetical protein ATK36_3204 [Amycolatopsis sulphurea]